MLEKRGIQLMKHKKILTIILSAALLTALTGCSEGSLQHSEPEHTELAETETTAEPAETEQTGTTRKVSADGKPVETFPSAVLPPPETTEAETTETAASAAPAEQSHPDFSDAAVKRYAAENSETRSVSFAYPEFGAELEHANEVNAIVRQFSEDLIKEYTSVSTWTTKDEPPVFDLTWGMEAPVTEDSEALVNFDADYTITRMDERYVSVLFEGFYYMSRAAYPFTTAEGLVIDMQTLKAVSLTDLYTVDEAFANFVHDASDQYKQTVLAEKLGVSPEQLLGGTVYPDLENLTEANTSARTSISVFMYPDSLGICIPIQHALGDHYEITIPYEELETFAR